MTKKTLLASLGHVLYFGFNLRSNFEQKCESFCIASLGHVLYLRFNLRSSLEQKCQSFCLALRSAMSVISLQSRLKFGAKIRELPRFARRSATSHVLYFRFNIRSNLDAEQKWSFCLASLGRVLYHLCSKLL